VIIGGLVSSTLLTMLLLPTLYQLAQSWFGGDPRAPRGSAAPAAAGTGAVAAGHPARRGARP